MSEETAVALELTYPHIKKPEGEPAQLQRIPRIRVAQIVMDYVAHGWSPDEMCRQHPYLTPGEAHAAMAYYFDHQTEIDQEIHAEFEQITKERSQSSSSPVHERLRTLGSP